MNAREQQIADYIDAYWEEQWTSPTVREICAHVGLASKSTVHGYLLRMTEAGILERKDVGRYRILYRVQREA